MKKILFAALASCFALNAAATVHSYEFEAAISTIGDNNTYTSLQSSAGQLLGTTLAIGDRIAGRFSYDTDTPVSWSYSGLWGATYFSANAHNTINFTALPSGFANLPSSGASLSLGDEGSRRYLSVSSGIFSLDLFDNSSTVLAMDRLPDQLSLSNLNGFVNAGFNRSDDGHYMFASAKLTSLTEVSAVPEANTYAMLLAGLMLMAAVARRHRAPGEQA